MRIEPVNTAEFKPNSYFEQMARIRDEQPTVFAILSPSEKLTLKIYEEQKAKHQKERAAQ